ncbi:MAG: tyrosine-type recombinase/integrase [Gammaproteobacteria bacterium]|nr:tyrosine-type recombinase/integrase [Gammaproteobacteria bacterium]
MISYKEIIMMRKTRKTKQTWSPEESEARYTQRRIERADAGNQPTLTEFAQWLADSRGLSPGTITLRIGSASTFVDAATSRAGCSCARAFRSITVQQIEEFFVEYGKDHGMPARRSMNTAMRSFLEFGTSRGWVGREMRDCVPSLISYRLSDVPRGISDEQLSKLLATPWTGKCPRRDYAIVVLLATYGARRAQVSALQLTDIDWHERTIDFAAHKGGKAIHHVLTDAVAQALGEYLNKERPTSDCDYVFLRQIRPYVRLSPGAITAMVGARTQRCGLPTWHPHAFRHAFATRLLRAGQPVKAIADLLGHRSFDAVSIYAKVDFARLIEAAVEWPEVSS